MRNDTVKQLEEVIPSLYNFIKQRVGFSDDISQIIFKTKPDPDDDPVFGKTAYYDPTEKSVTLYTSDRHPKDILRSFSHEMIHHDQRKPRDLNQRKKRQTRIVIALLANNKRTLQRTRTPGYLLD